VPDYTINTLRETFKNVPALLRNKPLRGFLPRKLEELYSQNNDGNKELVCLLMALQAALDWPEQEAHTKQHKKILDLAREHIDKAVRELPRIWRLTLEVYTSKLKADAEVFLQRNKSCPVDRDSAPLQVVQLLASIVAVKRPAPPAAALHATAPPPPPPPPPAPAIGPASLPHTLDSGTAASPVTLSPSPSIVDSSEESEGWRGESPPPLAASSAAEHTGAVLIAAAVCGSGGGGGSCTDDDAAAAAAEAAASEESVKRAEDKRANEIARQDKIQRRAARAVRHDGSGSSRSDSGGSASPPAAAASSAFRFDFYSPDVERAVRDLSCTADWPGSLANLKSFTDAPSVEDLRSQLAGVRKVMNTERQLDIVKHIKLLDKSWRAIKTIEDASGKHARVYRLDLTHDLRVCIVLNVRARIIAVYSVFHSTHEADDRRYLPSADYVRGIAQQF